MFFAFCFMGLTVKRLPFILNEILALNDVRAVKTLGNELTILCIMR